MKKKILNQLIAAVLVCGSVLSVINIRANAEEKIGMINENGQTYLYNALGQKETGWANFSGKWYYFNEKGEMQKSITEEINHKKFKFDESGIAVDENGTPIGSLDEDKIQNSINAYGTHLEIENGKVYYYNESNQKTGWVNDLGKMYYYNEKGEMQKSTTVKDFTGKEVKLNEKGVAVGEHGYDLIDGEEVTYDSSEAYKVSHKQWKKVGEGWYYYDDLGTKIANSWQRDNGLYYHFDADGKMQKNTTIKDWKGNDCVLNADGALSNRSNPDISLDDNYSWKQENGNWYYMNSDGYKETGWIQTNNKWYYCNEDGVMQKSTTIIDHDVKYALGADGAWIQ